MRARQDRAMGGEGAGLCVALDGEKMSFSPLDEKAHGGRDRGPQEACG